MKNFVTASIWVTIFMLLSACSPLDLETNNLPELPYAPEMQATLDTGLAEYGGMGISVAVLVPGFEIWTGVSGVSHGTTPITPYTLFSAGSINKMYTAVTVLQLAEEGRLSLDDPISKWLPEYPQVDSTITIRQLLNHTGGIFDMVRHPDYWDAMKADPDQVWRPEEIIQNFLLEPYFTKGKGWHYSTPGYILLRMIIQEITNENVSTAYRDRLFTPLKLRNTYVAGLEELPEETAHGWFDLDGDGSYDDLQSFRSFETGIGGAVYATPEDLVLWSQALFREHRFLKDETFEQMLAFHSPTPGEPLLFGYGLGVVKFNPELFNGLEVWGHSGNAPGYAAACFYLPDYDVSLSMMVNTDAGETMSTIFDLLPILTTNLEAGQ